MKRKVIAAHEKTVLIMIYGPGYRIYKLEHCKKEVYSFGTLLDAKIAYNRLVPLWKQLDL